MKIESVKETVSGTDAFHAPLDNNGNPCGLVKVLSTIEDLTFEGQIVGDVENKTNEYHVFLAKGSNEIKIKRPHILPLVVKFADFGIGIIVSKATYSIVLKEVKMNANKNSFVFSIHPKEANVYVDELLIDNENEDGFYQLLLPKGEHVVRFEAKGFRPLVDIVKAGKDAINNKYELESLLATLDVRCQTSTAEIWIGDEMKGKGAWQGKLPAGMYTVTAKQKGFTAQTKKIQLEEKGSRSLVLPILERAMGKLLVCTDPKDAVLTIDGQSGYKSGIPIDIKTGQHTIIATLPFGYKEEKMEYEVDDEKMKTINIKMKPKDDLYAAAFDGNIDKQIQLLNSIDYDIDSPENAYWCRRLSEELMKLDDNSFLFYSKGYWNINFNLELKLRRAELDKDWDDDDMLKAVTYESIIDDFDSLGNYREALLWAMKLDKFAPIYNTIERYYKIAQLYEKIGENTEAIEWCKKSYGLIGDGDWLIDTHREIAETFLRLGAKNDAIKVLEHIISKHPNNQKIEELKILLGSIR